MTKETKKAQLPATKDEPVTQVNTTNMNAMFMEDEGLGRETMTAKDLAIPRLSILQALSPQCTKGDAAYIKGAESGEVFDNINRRRFNGEEGLIVIPVSFRRTNLEWKTRKNGGGFVADHGASDSILLECTKNEMGQDILPNGNEVITVAEYFCFIIDPETKMPSQCVLTMSKTQFKKAKLWNSMMTNLLVPKPDGSGNFNPAIFYMSYKLTTVPESNDKGNWFGWKIEPNVPTVQLDHGSDLYLASRAFRAAIASGAVKVADHEDDVVTSTRTEDNDI